MEITPPNAQVSITTLATYQQSVQILQRTTIHSLPAFPDNIIDHVEIETRRPLPTHTDIIKYNSSRHYPLKDKGKFVDIWI
jgi:hypothetical protein